MGCAAMPILGKISSGESHRKSQRDFPRLPRLSMRSNMAYGALSTRSMTGAAARASASRLSNVGQRIHFGLPPGRLTSNFHRRSAFSPAIYARAVAPVEVERYRAPAQRRQQALPAAAYNTLQALPHRAHCRRAAFGIQPTGMIIFRTVTSPPRHENRISPGGYRLQSAIEMRRSSSKYGRLLRRPCLPEKMLPTVSLIRSHEWNANNQNGSGLPSMSSNGRRIGFTSAVVV